jgi:hypothetical protein
MAARFERYIPMQTAHLIMVVVLVAAILLEVIGFLGAEGWLLHHHLKLLW